MVRRVAGMTVINAGTLRPDHAPCWAVADFVRRYIAFYRPGQGSRDTAPAELFFETAI